MEPSPPTDLWEPCDVWQKLSKPTQFKTLLARLIVWLILPITCAYITYFVSRLLNWTTYSTGYLLAFAFYGVLMVHAPYAAWSYELRHNPYACVATSQVRELATQESELLRMNKAYVRWYDAHVYPSWFARGTEGGYVRHLRSVESPVSNPS
ncbi:hypothetical protein Q7P37_007293 [Cladosporium fusiforme]